MLKKYLLIGILVITVALVISAFTLVSIDRSRSNGLKVGQSMPSVMSADTNFRIAHTWNGIFIPSMDVTGSLGVVGATAADEPYPSPYPANYSPSSADTNFRIAHMWNGIKIPSMDVTGSLGVSR
jgi:hypothetical protein